MTRITRRRSGGTPSASRYINDEVEDGYEDEETPRHARRSADTRSRRDEDDSPLRPAGRRTARRPSAGGGWNALVNAKTSTYAENLKVGKDDTIIKFLDPEPYIIFKQHWIQEVKSKKKSYFCPEEDCPLCELGDRPRLQAYFNVIDLSDPQKPVVKTWATSKRLAEKIHGLAQKPKTSPLDREDLYWAVSRSGEGTSTEYNLMPVSADDLADWVDADLDVQPLSADELEELREKCQTADDVFRDSLEDLEKVADEIG